MVDIWGPLTMIVDGDRIPLYGKADQRHTKSEIKTESNEDGSMRVSEEMKPAMAEFSIFVPKGLDPKSLHGKTGDVVFFSPTNGRVTVYQNAIIAVNGTLDTRTGEYGGIVVSSEETYTDQIAA